jgi:hypothetical protein
MTLKIRKEGSWTIFSDVNNYYGVNVDEFCGWDDENNTAIITNDDGSHEVVQVFVDDSFIDMMRLQKRKPVTREDFGQNAHGETVFQKLKALENTWECKMLKFKVGDLPKKVIFNDVAYLCNDRGETIEKL